MNVLSLFDGISCGQYCLKSLGIPVQNYYASEVDKYAIQVTKKNYPETIHIGDVRRINITGRTKIDLLIGGSPCQGFSVAGKGLNFDDPRSKLFFEYARILKALQRFNPSILFLLENVRMKKEWQDIISEHLGVEPVKINSSLVSAQNRVRFYWTNFPTEQPIDRGIVLGDILEDDVDERYYLSESALSRIRGVNVTERGVRFHRGDKRSSGISELGIISFSNQKTDSLISAHSPKTFISGTINKNTFIGRENKSLNLDANYFKGNDNHGARTMIMQINPSKESGGVQPYQQNRVYDSRGKMPALNEQLSGRNNVLYYGIRRLTPIECERLQGLPDNYTQGVSDSQRYKQLGNGWQCDTVKHIFKSMPIV